MSVFFDTYINITPPLTTGWQTVDLTAHSVPADAVAIIRTAILETYKTGARKTGSTDNRTSVATWRDSIPIYIGCNASSQVDLYRENATSVAYYLCGYLTSNDAVCFTNGVDKTPALSGWQTVICSEVPSNATYAIFEFAIPSYGVTFRKTGSTDNRIQNNYNARHSWFIVGLDVNKQCDIWQNLVQANTVFLMGYITSGLSNTNGVDKSLSVTGSYQDVNVSAIVSSETTAVIVEVFGKTYASGSYSDLRKNGITQALYRWGMGICGTYIVPVDSNKIIEGKIEYTDCDFYVLGYIEGIYTYSGEITTTFELQSDYYHEHSVIGNTLLDLNLQSTCQYSRPNYNGNIKLSLTLNPITGFNFIPVIVTESNFTLKLKFTSVENEGLGTIKPSFVLNSLTERTNVFGTNDPDLTINLSSSQGDCNYDIYQIGASSYSPRVVIESIVPTTFELLPNIFVSCKPLVEWYESNNFINDTIISGGEVTALQIPETNDNNVLPNFDYMSYNFPFVGYGRPRKIFAKNISGFPLRYLHFGIDYPNIEVNDVNLITSGTDIDTWNDAHSGWTSTGLIKDAITIDQQYDIVVEVEYKMFANLVLWEGQMCKISDRNYSVWGVIQNVTEVDTYTSLITLSILEPLRRGFDASKTLLIGLKSISDIEIDEYVPIWLYNYIPFNASEVTNQKTRLFAHGVI